MHPLTRHVQVRSREAMLQPTGGDDNTPQDARPRGGGGRDGRVREGEATAKPEDAEEDKDSGGLLSWGRR
uniref:Uncharacterized protein n=1 Tax=Arundo donax TaxID=35708 RepID=A0A0A9AT71_ARUDO